MNDPKSSDGELYPLSSDAETDASSSRKQREKQEKNAAEMSIRSKASKFPLIPKLMPLESSCSKVKAKSKDDHGESKIKVIFLILIQVFIFITVNLLLLFIVKTETQKASQKVK